jgi:hypothetical protein
MVEISMIKALLNGVVLLQIALTMGVFPARSESLQVPSLSGAINKDQFKALSGEPKPELERPTDWGEPKEVRVLVYVIDVDEIDSANQTFAASVYVEAHWNIPALRHKARRGYQLAP